MRIADVPQRWQSIGVLRKSSQRFKRNKLRIGKPSMGLRENPQNKEIKLNSNETRVDRMQISRKRSIKERVQENRKISLQTHTELDIELCTSFARSDQSSWYTVSSDFNQSSFAARSDLQPHGDELVSFCCIHRHQLLYHYYMCLLHIVSHIKSAIATTRSHFRCDDMITTTSMFAVRPDGLDSMWN